MKSQKTTTPASTPPASTPPASTPPASTHLKLADHDLIQVSGFRNWLDIRVGTLKGYADGSGFDLHSEGGPAAIKRAIRFGHSLAPWAAQESACLDSDYPGKHAALDAKAARRARAPMVAAGQVVEIEGHLFTVRVNGERFSDPVGFEPVDATGFRLAMEAEADLA